MRLTEEKILTDLLFDRFRLEAKFEGGSGQFYALTPRNDGTVKRHRPMNPASSRPLPEQMMFAADVLKLLNRELHRDGAWVICFTNPKPPKTESIILVDGFHSEFARYALMWLDADGDPQLIIDWVEGSSSDLRDFSAVLRQGLIAVGQKAEAAWEMWAETRAVLDLREGQTFKRAQGQRAASVH